HYFCKRCGALKRAPDYPRLPKEPVPLEWPRCCGRLMQDLDYEKAAAVVKLTPSARLTWSSLGQHIFRGRRWGIWKAALTEHDVIRAIQARADSVKKISLPPARVRKSPMKPR